MFRIIKEHLTNKQKIKKNLIKNSTDCKIWNEEKRRINVWNGKWNEDSSLIGKVDFDKFRGLSRRFIDWIGLINFQEKDWEIRKFKNKLKREDFFKFK